MMLDIRNTEQLNEVFCELVGIPPIQGIIINNETGEVKTYKFSRSLYKTPKGWSNVKKIAFEKPTYPDFTDVENFYIILNIQWEMFGSLGDSYLRLTDESFPANYLFNKIKALKVLKSYGGTDMMAEYCKRVRESEYSYFIEED